MKRTACKNPMNKMQSNESGKDVRNEIHINEQFYTTNTAMFQEPRIKVSVTLLWLYSEIELSF